MTDKLERIGKSIKQLFVNKTSSAHGRKVSIHSNNSIESTGLGLF